MIGDWWASLFEDRVDDGPYHTKDEAISAARELLRDELALSEPEVGRLPGTGEPLAYIAQEVPAKLGTARRSGPIYAHLVIEQLAEHVAEQLGDEHPDRDTWPEVTPEQTQELEAELNATFMRWFEKHGFRVPTTFDGAEAITLEDAP